ncbi:MAG: 50S ribosomal protein L3 [ANME-2 cluster archaeon]|nr:50S ribosomal protein L3 [ANME-2 cluster archaeon]
MPTIHRPRRGSLAFSPRKKAKKPIARIRSWRIDGEEPKIQDFAGYKAGMTHVLMIDDRPSSITAGIEISVPVTIIETPAMRAVALRAYTDRGYYGMKLITEVWADHDNDNIERALAEGTVREIRAVVQTMPHLVSGIPKKTPDVMETLIAGGDVAAQFEYGRSILGKEYQMADLFAEGEFVDVAAITTGKGTQGPVKRWGVQLQKGKHSRTGKKRHIGNLGPWSPHYVRRTVPLMGQTGYYQRTEFNKRIFKIGSDGTEVTPDGGFINYGIVRNGYVMVRGSVPGPSKRLIRMRPPIRGKLPLDAPAINYISTESHQG